MKLHAKKQFLFGKEVLNSGAEFETNDAHGRELIARGMAQEVKQPSEKPEETKRRSK